ncbi:hypothetical protein FRC10_006838, partial [Ceratobasidium sp. 414]
MELDDDERQSKPLVKVKRRFDQLRALINDIKYPTEAARKRMTKQEQLNTRGKMRVHDLKFPERIREQVNKCRKLVRKFSKLGVVSRTHLHDLTFMESVQGEIEEDAGESDDKEMAEEEELVSYRRKYGHIEVHTFLPR